MLKKDKLTVLSIRDYHTTGLTGTDEDRRSNWYSMIRSVGSSHKSNDAGGSFGIGKNAPFAASALRTVFYSTRLADGQVAFQGVARLVTHCDTTNKPTQGTGYYGLVDAHGHPKSIREEARIPTFFRRKEQGTDIHILGYLGSDNWMKLLERATLEHFWPAISWGHLVVEIADSIINQQTLAGHMEAARSEALANNPYFAGFNEAAFVYYDAYANHQHQATKVLKQLGAVQAFFRVGEADLPNQVAMIRKTGMVIYRHGSFRGLRLKFAGAFVCDDQNGNELLRRMEPPRHDKWDVDLPAKGASQAVKKEYHTWLRETLVGLTPKIDTKVLAVDELADYLPDTISPDGSAGKQRPTDDSTPGNTQEPNEISEPVITETVAPTAKKPAPQPDETPKPPADDPDPEKENSGGATDKDTDDADEKPPQKKTPPVLQAKGFADARAGEYIVVLRASQPATVTVALTAVGEDAFTEEVKLLSARDQATNAALAVGGNKIEQLDLLADKPRRVAVAFNDFARRAVTISIYEV